MKRKQGRNSYGTSVILIINYHLEEALQIRSNYKVQIITFHLKKL